MTEQELRAVIAANILAGMERIGVKSQAELSRLANIPQTTLNIYMSPHRPKGLPNLRHLVTLSKIFQMETWELLCPVSEAERNLMRSMEEWLKSKRGSDES